MSKVEFDEWKQLKMMNNQKLRFSSLCVLVLCCSALNGCSQPGPVMGNLDGKVTLDGQPFSEGRIELKDAKTGVSAAAELQADGSFKLATPPRGGIQVGNYAVVVLAPPPPAVDPIESAKGVQPKVEVSKIPAAYREYATSGFTVTVAEGPNHAEFAMKSK